MAQTMAEDGGRVPMSTALQATLLRARDYASGQAHPQVLLEHLLLALTEDGDALHVLSASHVDIARLRNDIAGYMGSLGDRAPPGSPAGPSISSALTQVLKYATLAAQQGRRQSIDGAIVLAALVGDGRSMAANFLKAQGLTFEAAIKALRESAARAPITPVPEPTIRRPDSHPPANHPGDQLHGSTEANPANGGANPAVSARTEDLLATARERVEHRSAGQAARVASPTQSPLPNPPAADDATMRPQPSAPAEPPAPNPAPSPMAATSEETMPAVALAPDSRVGGQPGPDRPIEPLPPRHEPAASQASPPVHAPGAARSAHPDVHGLPSSFEHDRGALGAAPVAGVSGEGAPGAGSARPTPAGFGTASPSPAPPFPGMPAPATPTLGGPGPAPPSLPSPVPRGNPIPHPPRASRTDSGGHAPRPPASPPRPFPPAREGGGAGPGASPGFGPNPGLGGSSGPMPGELRPRSETVPTAPHSWPGAPNQPQAAPPGRRYGPQSDAPYQPPPTTSFSGGPQGAAVAPSRMPAIDAQHVSHSISGRMRQGRPEIVEVRIDRPALAGSGNRANPHVLRSEAVVARAIAVKLRPLSGSFAIDAISPETQWDQGTGPGSGRLASEAAVWRFSVLPLAAGRGALQLSVSARTIGADGVLVETQLPDQGFEVKSGPDLGRSLRGFGYVVAAFLGGIVAIKAIEFMLRTDIAILLRHLLKG